MKNIVLFDDERSFKADANEGAIVLRSVEVAEAFFSEMRSTGFVIDELWLDFVLTPGATTDALPTLPGEQVKRVFFHSSAYDARSLVEHHLKKVGFKGEVELPTPGVYFN